MARRDRRTSSPALGQAQVRPSVAARTTVRGATGAGTVGQGGPMECPWNTCGITGRPLYAVMAAVVAATHVFHAAG
jgi:hypothetical protein